MIVTRIKIISNPYERLVSYQRWDEAEDVWRSISSDDNPHSYLHSESLTRGFFPYKAEEIVQHIVEDYRAGEQPIVLVFEGCDDEYEEMRVVCESGAIANAVRLERSPRYLRNARDILPEFQRAFEAVKPSLDGFAPRQSEAVASKMEKIDDISKDVTPICVLGDHNSGKSTFINALIGHELLPSGDECPTTRVHKIHRSEERDAGCITFTYAQQIVRLVFDANGFDKDNSHVPSMLHEQIACHVEQSGAKDLIRSMNSTLVMLNTLESAAYGNGISDCIDITVPFADNDVWWGSHEFVVFDTPALDSAYNDEVLSLLADAMIDMSYALPIYVSEYDSLDSAETLELFEDVSRIDAIDDRFAILVVNKADAARVSSSDFDDAKRTQIMDWAVPRDLHAQGIYFVSSIMGLASKTKGIFADEGYRRAYSAKAGRYFSRRRRGYEALYRLDLVPSQIEARVIRGSEACDDLLLANSGLYCLEREIGIFAERYSIYNKCHEAQSQLREIVGVTSKRIEQTKAQLGEETLLLEQQLDGIRAGLLRDLQMSCDRAKKESLQRCKLMAPLKIIRNDMLANASRLRRLHEKYDSDELLKEVQRQFDVATDELSQMVAEKSHAVFEQEMSRCTNTLIRAIANSGELSQEQKEHIADIAANHPLRVEEACSCVTAGREEFQSALAPFVLAVHRSRKLDLSKLAKTYNSSLRSCLARINDDVITSHVSTFEKWLDNLLQGLVEDIVQFNPEVRNLQQRIEEDGRKLAECSMQLELLKGCSENVSNLMDWCE